RRGGLMYRVVVFLALLAIVGCAAQKPAATTQTSPEPASSAPGTAAPATPPAGPAAAPSPTADQDAIKQWQLAVITHLLPFMGWPNDAPYWVDKASSVVQVTIDRQGHVLNAVLVQSSGYSSFDVAARRIFKRAATLPPPPSQMPGNPLTFH